MPSRKPGACIRPREPCFARSRDRAPGAGSGRVRPKPAARREPGFPLLVSAAIVTLLGLAFGGHGYALGVFLLVGSSRSRRVALQGGGDERTAQDGRSRPRYMISVAAELVGMHPQTLRIYEQKGLVRPKRTAGNTRLYSDEDVERLQLIQRLTSEIGLNLAGVERVLHLEDELARMRLRSTGWSAKCARRSEQVHRQYRRDLVVYRPRSRRRDATS